MTKKVVKSDNHVLTMLSSQLPCNIIKGALEKAKKLVDGVLAKLTSKLTAFLPKVRFDCAFI